MSENIRILVLNPVSVEIWNELTYKYLEKIIESSTQIVVKNVEKAPPAIEYEYDKVLAEHLVVEEVVKANKEGFNAVVINCFDDPGLYASREVSDIPVFGIGETSLYYALMIGNNIAIISTGRHSSIIYRRRVRELGIEDRVVYIAGIEMPVLDLRKDERKTIDMLVKELEKAVNNYNADVAVLGCGGLIGLADYLSNIMNMPVIDPTLVTVKIAEASAKLKYRHSKKFSAKHHEIYR
jgi:allantoin racemase